MIKLNSKTKEELDAFCKIHNLNSYEEALDKLISCYKAWNLKLFKPCTKRTNKKIEILNYKEEIERRIEEISFIKDGVRVSKDWDTLKCLLSKREGYNQGIKDALRRN